MDIDIVITKEGGLSVFIKQGAFAEAKEKIEQLLAGLGLEGIEFEMIGDVERHTHNQPEVHQHELHKQKQ